MVESSAGVRSRCKLWKNLTCLADYSSGLAPSLSHLDLHFMKSESFYDHFFLTDSMPLKMIVRKKYLPTSTKVLLCPLYPSRGLSASAGLEGRESIRKVRMNSGSVKLGCDFLSVLTVGISQALGPVLLISGYSTRDHSKCS